MGGGIFSLYDNVVINNSYILCNAADIYGGGIFGYRQRTDNNILPPLIDDNKARIADEFFCDLSTVTIFFYLVIFIIIQLPPSINTSSIQYQQYIIIHLTPLPPEFEPLPILPPIFTTVFTTTFNCRYSFPPILFSHLFQMYTHKSMYVYS